MRTQLVLTIILVSSLFSSASLAGPKCDNALAACNVVIKSLDEENALLRQSIKDLADKEADEKNAAHVNYVLYTAAGALIGYETARNPLAGLGMAAVLGTMVVIFGGK